MIRATLRRWRALNLPNRVAIGLLMVMLFLIGGMLASLRRPDSWPARAVLRDTNCALPLAYSPDGKTFLTTGRDGITSWDAASGREGKTWAIKSGGSPVVWAFSPDGRIFAAAMLAYPGPLSIHLIDTSTGKTRATLGIARQMILHLAYADDGQTLRAFLADEPLVTRCGTWNSSCGSDLNEVVTLDAETGQQISSRPLTAPTRAAITAISADGRTLAISDRMTPVLLWDLDADRAIGTLPNPATTSKVNSAGFGFSLDGQTLAIGRMDGTIELWDVSTLRLLNTLPSQTGDFVFTSIQFSPDGRNLALSGYLWGLKSSLAEIQDQTRRMLGMSPKYDAVILIQDVATGRKLAGGANSTRPYFSPDGRTIATQEPDGSTRLRDIPHQ
jgi:WD40 repeat protein